MRRLLLLLAAASCAAACSSSTSLSPLPDLSLPTVAGGSSAPLSACKTAKCLKVYLTPWCPHCREAGPWVVKLQALLAKKGVAVDVIVGQDQPAALLAYARQFGPDTLIDREPAVRVNGVPHFFSLDGRGRLIKDVSGFPAGYRGTTAELAAYFGLL